MPAFGTFEIDREIHSDASCTVYAARKECDYVIKLFHVQGTSENNRATGRSASVDSEGITRLLEALSLQQKAAAASAFIAPVFETGQDERGVWYASRSYPRSVESIITGRVALNPEALRHILLSVTQGALDLKRAAGRSHGALRPSRVRLSKSEKLTQAEVVISEPLVEVATHADHYEKADLRAIGELLYQLVFRQTVDFAWVMVPLDLTPEWTRMFGRQSTRWLELCNRLLDPNLSLDRFSLEDLVRELQPVPHNRVALVAACVASVLVLGGAAFLVMRPRPARQPEPLAQRPQKLPTEVPRAAEVVVPKPAVIRSPESTNTIPSPVPQVPQVPSQQQICAEAKERAMAAERGGQWPQALSAWVESEKACPDDNSVQNESRFVRTLLRTGQSLSDLQARTNGPSVELERLTNDCAQTLSILHTVDDLAARPARRGALSDLNNQIEQLAQTAARRIPVLKQQEQCSLARKQAQEAEGAKPWREVAAFWTQAREKCNDAALDRDMSFALILAQAAQQLSQAQSLTNGPAAAQQGGDLCANAQSNLLAHATDANTQPRMDEVQRLTNAFCKVSLAVDLILAEDALGNGQYTNALQFCAKHPDAAEFTQLQERIRSDQEALQSFESKLKVADYSFLAAAAPYESKKPFADVLKRAKDEKSLLDDLTRLKKLNNWRAVMRKFNPSAEYASKPPFVAMYKWAKAWDDSAKAQADAAELLGRSRTPRGTRQ